VKARGQRLGGELHGAWKFFRIDGSLMRSGSFDRGRQIGAWKTYTRDGSLVKSTDFGR
jgi:antitoxin component YwqK of YwqJK toxin-antitoxin module